MSAWFLDSELSTCFFMVISYSTCMQFQLYVAIKLLQILTA